jgi:hypothetical protein
MSDDHILYVQYLHTQLTQFSSDYAVDNVDIMNMLTEEDPDGSSDRYLLVWNDLQTADHFTAIHTRPTALLEGVDVKVRPHTVGALRRHLQSAEREGATLILALNADPVTGAVNRFLRAAEF